MGESIISWSIDVRCLKYETQVFFSQVRHCNGSIAGPVVMAFNKHVKQRLFPITDNKQQE